MKSSCFLALFACTGLSSAPGAVISWSFADFENVTQLSTQGSLVRAENLGNGASNQTVNGITFTSGGTGTNLDPVVGSKASAGIGSIYDDGLAANAITGMLAAQANNLFDTVMYVGGAGNNRINLTDLTSGQTYQFQFFGVDNRDPDEVGGIDSRFMDVGYNTTVVLDDVNVGGGGATAGIKLFTGTFTADATTQTLLIANRVPADNNVQIGAYQLRAIPEPSSSLLIGVAGFGLLLRRRK